MKNPKYGFMVNIILNASCEFQYFSVTLPMKESYKEQRSVIRFLWAEEIGANAVHSEMHPVYGDRFTSHSNTYLVKKICL